MLHNQLMKKLIVPCPVALDRYLSDCRNAFDKKNHVPNFQRSLADVHTASILVFN